jgi:hypothetical protein
MDLIGILLALGLWIWLAYRGWSVLLSAPAAALIAAAVAREPLLAHWTQTFMGNAVHFIAPFYPLSLLGALFIQLMDDGGSVGAIAQFMTARLGRRRAILAVVLAGALVTYGGVSVFVAFFVLAPMAQAMFRAAIPILGRGPTGADIAASEPPAKPMSADRVRWEHIQRIYELCDRNVSETSRRLGMHRRTLQRILARHSPK